MHTPTLSARNRVGMYDAVDRYIAEIYDSTETQRDDVELILSLVGDRQARILEPFCGHGRILLPLVEAGHRVVGIDLSGAMLGILEERLRELPREVRARASCRRADVIADPWPGGFDVVVLGANCFYELASAAEQEHCIEAASRALEPGGYLYLDNNHMEGALAPSWTEPGVNRNAFPCGVCADGTEISGTSATIWHDAESRLVRFRRTATVRSPDGSVSCREWVQQKHPPSTDEMAGWLEAHGLTVLELWGDRQRSPYTERAGRAVFWAQRR